MYFYERRSCLQRFMSILKINIYILYLKLKVARVVVAEWLRRWTRNPLGSSRAGSNPADNAYFSYFFIYFFAPIIEYILKFDDLS